MKNILTLTICLLCGVAGLFAQQGDSLRISLLTYSPGPDLYTAFGHSALRVKDLRTGNDVLYNYGTFDFGTPNFYGKFIKGKLLYQLGLQSTERVFDYYERQGNKLLTEQILLLSPDETTRINAFLQNNRLPVNRDYLYDFFFDNCATRIRDILESELPGRFEYRDSLNAEMTFRQLLDLHIEDRPWGDFGIDLILGMPADRVATHRDQMFLPGFLSKNLNEDAFLIETDSSGQAGRASLFAPARIVVDGTPYKNNPGWFTPFTLFGALCLVMLLLTLVFTHNRWLAILDGIWFFVLGFVGCFLLFMWLGTDHQATARNLNIIWANPLYLFLFLPVMLRRRWAMLATYGMALALGVPTLLAWGALPQAFHTAAIPIILMLLVRSGSVVVYLWRKGRRKGILLATNENKGGGDE